MSKENETKRYYDVELAKRGLTKQIISDKTNIYYSMLVTALNGKCDAKWAVNVRAKVDVFLKDFDKNNEK